MEKFTLQHVVLYTKGWYKRTEFWEDIKKCLSADGYSGDIMTNTDCVTVIVKQFERLPKSYAHNLLSIIEGIQDRHCWKFGYYTKTNDTWGNSKSTEEYDIQKAIIKYCLSYFMSLSFDQWNVCPPNPKKCLPFSEDVTLKKVIEMFNNKKSIHHEKSIL